jgi:large subunit ribosomal protein L9
MKVVLKQDMDTLGFEGDVVDVAKGHARNFLIPKGLAMEATEQNLKFFETQKIKIEARKLKAKEEAERVRERLAALVVTIAQKAGEEDKLYGSVTSMDIADHLEKQSVTIDKRKIILDKPIKMLGEYDVPIKLYPEVTGTVRVVVVPEE